MRYLSIVLAFVASIACAGQGSWPVPGPSITTVSELSLTDGLVGHWSFDTGDINWSDIGSEIKDSSVNENHGNASASGMSALSVIAGKVGQGLAFDGVGNSVLIGDPASGALDFGATASFTFAIWFRSSDRGVFLLGKRDSAQGYEILAGVGNVNGDIACRIDDNILEPVYSATWTGTNDGEWHHVACVVDRANGEFRIYGDGEKIGTATSIVGLGDLSTTSNLRIGSRSSNNSFLGGDLDDFRIYDLAVGDGVIAALYQLGM